MLSTANSLTSGHPGGHWPCGDDLHRRLVFQPRTIRGSTIGTAHACGWHLAHLSAMHDGGVPHRAWRHCARRASPLPSTCVSPDRARSQSHISQKEGRKEFSRLSEGDAMDAGHTHVLRPTPTPTPYPYQNIKTNPHVLHSKHSL